MTTDPARARSPGWIKIVLAVSLALNLAVAGVLGGLSLRRAAEAPAPGQMRGDAAPGLSLRHALAALPDEDRRALRQAWRADLQGDLQLAPNAAPAGLRRPDVLALLRANELDRDALRAALELPQARAVAAGRAGAALLVEHLAGMDTDERRAYADRLEQRLTQRRSTWRPRSGSD